MVIFEPSQQSNFFGPEHQIFKPISVYGISHSHQSKFKFDTQATCLKQKTHFPNMWSILKEEEKKTNKQTTNHGPINSQKTLLWVSLYLSCVQIRLGLVGYLLPLRSRQNRSECKFHNQNFKPDLWWRRHYNI